MCKLAVKLRLRRMGKKKQPFYRIVAADSRAARNGRFIETIGTYDPLVKPYKADLKEDRIFYWLENGAQPTETVKSLFKNKGLWLKWDLKKQGADEAKIAEEFSKWSLLREQKMQRLAAQEAQAQKTKAKQAAEAQPEETVEAQKTAVDAPEAATVEETAAEVKSPEENTAE